MQNRIDSYFKELEKFIRKIPISEEGKNYIWFDSYCKFYDEPVLSEDGKTTYGIQTEWQLQRFEEQFHKNFQKLRIKGVEKWTDDLNNIEPTEAIKKLDKSLYLLKKKELIAEIGGDSLNDWERWLIKYWNNEIDHQQKRPDIIMMQNFDCPFSLETVKAVHKEMTNKKYIEADLSDFLKVFNKEQGKIKKPIKWLIKHGTKSNKTALFTFLKLMLYLNDDEKFQRRYFSIINKVFAPENIFEKISYPNKTEQRTSRAKYFLSIKAIIENTRL